MLETENNLSGLNPCNKISMYKGVNESEFSKTWLNAYLIKNIMEKNIFKVKCEMYINKRIPNADLF